MYLLRIISPLAVLSLMLLPSCQKDGSDGNDADLTGIKMIKIKDTDTETCAIGKGGINIISYIDSNKNNTREPEEQIVETFTQCYLDNNI